MQVDTSLRGPQGEHCIMVCTMLLDVAKGMSCKVLLTKLVLMDSDLRPYLAVLLLAMLHKSGDVICIPMKSNIIELIKKDFNNFLANKGAKIYNNNSILLHDY